MSLVKVYTVQPLSVALQLQDGVYVPDLSKSFGSEHPYFMNAYLGIKRLYTELCGVPFLARESGLWGYLSYSYIDRSKLSVGEVVCALTLDSRFILSTSYPVWERILDGEGTVESLRSKLLGSKKDFQQLFFSSAVVEKVEIMNFS